MKPQQTKSLSVIITVTAILMLISFTLIGCMDRSNEQIPQDGSQMQPSDDTTISDGETTDEQAQSDEVTTAPETELEMSWEEMFFTELFGSVGIIDNDNNRSDDPYRISNTVYQGARYYGDYGGYTIVGCEGDTCEITDIVIAGEHFYFHRGFSLYAYKDRKFYDVGKVYRDGGLSDSDIAELAAIHKQMNEGLLDREWHEK